MIHQICQIQAKLLLVTKNKNNLGKKQTFEKYLRLEPSCCTENRLFLTTDVTVAGH